MLWILARHTVRHLREHAHLRRHRRSPSDHRSISAVRALRVRLLLEDLGVVAIKFGQILSTRPDVLPPEYETELSKLQDAAPPEPSARIEAVIEAELGRPLGTVFESFDPVPLAAASIGQAHAATLADGSDVVVKIRRPGVVAQVDLDLDLLTATVTTLSRWSRRARRYDVSGLAREFGQTLRTELDYEQEAAHAERFAANFADDPTIHIPRVYPEASTARVITLERLRGLKLDDLAGLDAAGIDRAQLAQRAADAILTMVFEHRFFHADLHPGNFFVEPDGRIGVVDFGMVGIVDATTRAALLGVLVAIIGGGTALLGDAITELGFDTRAFDQEVLLADLRALFATHLQRPLGELALGALLRDVLGVFRHHHLRLPANLAVLTKTFAMCEGVAAHLDPTFRMTAALLPYVQHLTSTEALTSP